MTRQKDDNKEFAEFSKALGKVLKVSHSELQSRMEESKRQKQREKGKRH